MSTFMKALERFSSLFTGRHLSTPLLGGARSIMAVSTALTLCTNHPGWLFEIGRPMDGVVAPPFDWTNFFHLTRAIHPFAGNVLGALLLLGIASGWRPRLTGLLHAWLANSFMRAVVIMEGGDQAHAIFAMLLVPVCLADSRRTHWDPPQATSSDLLLVASNTGWVLLRIQMAAIYLQAAVAKMAVPEWMDGSAVYYWSTHPQFGLSSFLLKVVGAPLRITWVVFALTWGSMLLELMLFAGLIAKIKIQRALLILGIMFHIGIMLIHGLFSFSLVMIAGLIIYLGPVSRVSESTQKVPTGFDTHPITPPGI